MFTKQRSFRSSVRGGAPYYKRPFNKTFGNGNFRKQNNSFSRSGRGGGRGMRKTMDISNLDVFVSKAKESIPSEENTVQRTFADFQIANPLKNNILNHRYTVPTPIQNQAIEPILEGRDLIGLASTGTGKTGAFLIPIIDNIFKLRDKKALIIAPTRELATQINDELRALAFDMRIYSALVIGGNNINRQMFDIRRNPHVVIGTPGRLRDLIKRNILNLEDFKIVVLDEVDLMVDIGFIEDVKFFVSKLPGERQSLFFSATIPAKVREILQAFVTNPVTVSINRQEASENIDQDIVRVIDRNKKVDQLHDLLIKDGFEKVLIFGATKHGVDKLDKELTFRGFKTGAIHGNKSQGKRKRVLESFKRSDIQILLATDVASRGLDIDSVTHVINYDLPQSYAEYVHRIGRTGRANKKGVALTFIE